MRMLFIYDFQSLNLNAYRRFVKHRGYSKGWCCCCVAALSNTTTSQYDHHRHSGSLTISLKKWFWNVKRLLPPTPINKLSQIVVYIPLLEFVVVHPQQQRRSTLLLCRGFFPSRVQVVRLTWDWSSLQQIISRLNLLSKNMVGVVNHY